MDAFSISFAVDDTNRVVVATASGPIASVSYVDRCIAFFQGLPEPWRYHRLYDEAACTGVVAYQDLERLARIVNPLWARATTDIKVAVVNASRLVAARMPMASQMYLHSNHRAFETRQEAELWLKAPADARG